MLSSLLSACVLAWAGGQTALAGEAPARSNSAAETTLPAPVPARGGAATRANLPTTPPPPVPGTAPQTAAPFPSAPASTVLKPAAPAVAGPVGAALTLPPLLQVSGASAQITQNCQSPQPAFHAKVTLINAGAGAMPAKSGGYTLKYNLYLKEVGGSTQLGGPPVAIPPLAPGQTVTLEAIGRTLMPYTLLGGSHQIGVHLTIPVWQGDHWGFQDSSPPAHTFTVQFPPNHCG